MEGGTVAREDRKVNEEASRERVEEVNKGQSTASRARGRAHGVEFVGFRSRQWPR